MDHHERQVPSGHPDDAVRASTATAVRRRNGPAVIATVAAGGALGSPARYELSRIIHVAKDTFPWATFWTNVTGSFALGLIAVAISRRFPPSRYLRPFFATGFVGAYTTFSTVMVESVVLAKDNNPVLGAAYLIASAGAGLGAVWTGMAIGGRLPLAPGRRATA